MQTNNDNESLKIAFSYLRDIIDSAGIISEISPNQAKDILKTIKLANKKLNNAEKENPNATAVIKDDENNQFELEIPKLRAGLLFYEGVVRGYGLGERSVAVEKIKQSIALKEDDSNSHANLGMFYADLGQKTKAIASIKRAIELDPNNMDLKKILDELENTSTFIFKTKAFSGSWKVFLAFLALSIVSFLMGNYIVFIIFGSIAGYYWVWKSKAKSKPTMLN